MHSGQITPRASPTRKANVHRKCHRHRGGLSEVVSATRVSLANPRWWAVRAFSGPGGDQLRLLSSLTPRASLTGGEAPAPESRPAEALPDCFLMGSRSREWEPGE